MSNLIKYNSFVVKDEGNVVIDSNQRVIDKLKSIKANMKTSIDADSGFTENNGFVSGLNAQVVEELVDNSKEEAEAAVAEADKILADAREQAAEIIAQAVQQAEEMKAAANRDGYTNGLKNAEDEVGKKLRKLEEEYSQKSRQLNDEYEKKVSKMEPMLVDTLLRVFSKVTHTMAEDKKDMILCLINSVMRNTEISKEFYIRVAPEDYKFTLNNQSRIYTAVAKDVHIEIAEDTSLNRNECIIETDAGVFDCSLDIQLENLIKDIRLLSCLND